MITEDYVSFEIAKLLKEKGFNVYVRSYYEKDVYRTKEEFSTNNALWNWNISNFRYSAPTLQMAMKWLREVHNKSIEVRSQGLKATGIGWVVEVYNLRNQDEEYHHPYTFPIYEEACEAAIKYCLENLI